MSATVTSSAALALVHVAWIGGSAQWGLDYQERGARAVEDVLTRLAPADATVERYAAKIYAVHVPGGRLRAIQAFGRHVATAFEQPIVVDGEEIVANAHVGIAVVPGPSDLPSLYRDAHLALEYARRDGEPVGVFSAELAARHDRGATIERNLRDAADDGRLTAAYQPIVRLSTTEVIGAEALMRWDCPGIGLVPPSEFIAVAVRSNLIVRLDDWMLREACAQLRRWHLAGFPSVHVAVNVSARSAQQRDFVKAFVAICASVALDPHDVQLELGEDAFDVDGPAARNLDALRRLGVRIAIDDFGSGASALSALGSLPLDALKIDRPFVAPIAADAYRAEVVRSVVSLAHSRGLQVVAEGVETPAQATALRAAGCDDAQGFLFGAPMPAADLFARLERERFGGAAGTAPGRL